MSVACVSDRKPDEVPVACTDEMHRKNEARKMWDRLMASERPLTG